MWAGVDDAAAQFIFQPSSKAPLDFEQTVERSLLEWKGRFALRGCHYDPYQVAATAQRLTRAGVRMIEFPQTPANLTAIGSNLFELIRARSIIAYPDNDISTALSHAIVKETARGLQITKEKSSHRIDIIISLAMAAHAAVQRPHVEAPKIVEPGIYSKQMGWVGAGTTNAGGRSTTQAYYDWMNSGAAYWPGSGPKEW
jgi:phage terminase large subunit-like protein